MSDAKHTRESLRKIADGKNGIGQLRQIASKLKVAKFVQLGPDDLIDGILAKQEEAAAAPVAKQESAEVPKAAVDDGFNVGDRATMLKAFGKEKLVEMAKKLGVEVKDDAGVDQIATDIASLKETAQVDELIRGVVRAAGPQDDEETKKNGTTAAKRLPPNATAEVNSLGFKQGSLTAWVCQVLEYGFHKGTEPGQGILGTAENPGQFLSFAEMVEIASYQFDDQPGSDAAKKRKKGTIQIIMSDLRAPMERINKYPATRALVIAEDPATKALRFEPTRLAEAKAHWAPTVQKKQQMAAEARAAMAGTNA